ncbi:MAG TPA: hypothetical protein VFX48_02575, partial [Saprospiraceae bacterium]|nr:hypothetical protein [Saprospiraceae bacterium]
MGCEFQFLEDAYRLPLRMLRGISDDYPRIIELDARQSSQFVSAMMLIAPALQNGLEIRTGADRVSDPYIRQTLLLMREMGETIDDDGISIRVESGYHFPMMGYAVESDWSAAAFFYARLALGETGSLFFPGLHRSGLQGDQKVAEFFTAFGVSTMETDDGIQIEKTKCEWPVDVQFDFTAFPDLFPPLAMFCAIRKVNARFNGLQHLEHKESNRLKVISEFLLEQSVQMEFTKHPSGMLSGVFHMSNFSTAIKDHYSSHGDHRIAMAFSLLNVLRPIRIDDPEVVGKSFPGYWEEMGRLKG